MTDNGMKIEMKLLDFKINRFKTFASLKKMLRKIKTVTSFEISEV